MADFDTKEVLAEIDKQAAAAGINPAIAKAIAIAENTADGRLKSKSKFNGRDVSPAGASGIMQVMPSTALGLQKAGYLPEDWKHDPADLPSQVQAGLAAIKEKLLRVKNPTDIGEIGSSYNGGTAAHKAYQAGNVADLPAETKQYIEKLRRAMTDLAEPSTASPAPAAQPLVPSSSPKGSSSVRTSTSRSVNDPGILADYLASLDTMTAPGGSFDAAAQAIQDQKDTQELLTPQVIQAITASGQSAAQIAGSEAVVAASEAARRGQILRQLNLDPASAGNELARVFDSINQADASLDTLRPDINARMSVGFFDNPLEWLVNQTRLPGMVEQYNGALRTKDAAVDRFKQITSVANTYQSLSAATDADAILNAGESRAKGALARAAEEAERFKLAKSGDDARTALSLAQLAGQRSAILAQGLAATRERETFSEGMSAKDAEVAYLDNINKVVAAAGGEPIASMAQLKMMPAEKKAALIAAASSSSFGKNFADSFNLLDTYGNKEKVAHTGGAAMLHWVQGTEAAVNEEVNKRRTFALASKTKFDALKDKQATLNSVQETYQAEAASDMRLASKYNPFKLDYVTAAKAPELKDNAVAQWINTYGPKGTEPLMPSVDENFLVSKFATGVKEGRFTAASAAKVISDFYTTATAKQREALRPTLFGLSIPPSVYQVRLAGIRDGMTAVDMGNPTQVENALTTKVAMDALRSYSNGGYENSLGISP